MAKDRRTVLEIWDMVHLQRVQNRYTRITLDLEDAIRVKSSASSRVL